MLRDYAQCLTRQIAACAISGSATSSASQIGRVFVEVGERMWGEYVRPREQLREALKLSYQVVIESAWAQ